MHDSRGRYAVLVSNNSYDGDFVGEDTQCSGLPVIRPFRGRMGALRATAKAMKEQICFMVK